MPVDYVHGPNVHELGSVCSVESAPPSIPRQNDHQSSPERLTRVSYGDLSIVRCILVDRIYSANVYECVFSSV